MSSFPSVFRRFIPQLLYILLLPVSFFAFLLLYRPTYAVELIGFNHFGVHLTLLSCIVFLSVIITRLMYYYIPMKLNYSLYTLWCVAEIIFATFFVALYVWLALYPHNPYFEVLTSSFQLLFMTLVVPYSILTLSLRISDYHEKSIRALEPAGQKKMRFYDEKHNLKIILQPDVILFIAAEENYVHINYLENEKIRNFVLRSSMKAIEEMCMLNGIVRCHRSFFVNPLHIKVLRKDNEGVLYAELDANDVRHIPVSKRYYESLSNIL